jgi:hypothetical protein
MTYRTKYQSGGILLLVLFGGSAILIPPAVMLFNSIDNGMLVVFSPMVIFFTMFFLSLKFSNIYTEVKITDEMLYVNKKEIPFAEITSYYLRTLTPRVSVLDIALKSGKEISVTGLNYGEVGEPMNQFIANMQERFTKAGSEVSLVESVRALKIKLYRKRWIAVIKGLIVFIGLFDVFVLIIVISGNTKGNMLMVLTINLMVPYLFVNMRKLK